jgi:valyl-tRNA synthetase
MPAGDAAALGAGPGSPRALVETLAGLDRIDHDAPAGASVAVTVDGREYRVSNLVDAASAGGAGVDAAAERARLTKLAADLGKSVSTLEGRLGNPGYVDRAPPAMVQQTRDQLAKARAELAAAESALREVGGAP